ncbi:MAG: tRNA ((34)-2-O)-methyltransferase [Pseudomonadota bacterium]|jgi:tRNA (cytidine/uridine-2'-O-)-methyltransferase
MMPEHLHVCLYQPEIPQNTGNIGRLVAGSQCRLHLIRPFAFSTEDKNLRRAGLDYWPYLDLEIHDQLDTLLDLHAPRIAFFSARSTRPYTEIPANTDLLVFGQETKGLPATLRDRYPDNFYTIPIFHDKVRSLNVANAVSIVLYHQLMKRKGYLRG